MPLRSFANNDIYLDGIKSELAHLNNNLLLMCSTLNDQQLNWCTNEHKWSVLQHLEHIHLHNISFIERSFNSLYDLHIRPDQKAVPQSVRAKPFRHSPSGSLYINSISADSRLKMRALPSFVPAQKLDRFATIERLKKSTEKMFNLIEESRKINLNNIKLTVPGCNLLFYLGDVLQIIVQHTKRHQKQIINLAFQPTFPKK